MQGKVKRFRWVAIVGLALLVVPIAQAKPVTLSQHGAKQQYQSAHLQELRAEGVAQLRALGTGSYPAGTTFPNGTTGGYPFATSATRDAAASNSKAASAGPTALGLKVDGMRWNAIAKAYQSGTGVTGVQVHYPFANENTAAFKTAEQKANGSPAPISENSPIEQRLNPSSPVSVPSTGSSFDYGDAGIGAGIAALLTSMLALGAGSAISRKRVAHG
jgi:hypothetical protein